MSKIKRPSNKLATDQGKDIGDIFNPKLFDILRIDLDNGFSLEKYGMRGYEFILWDLIDKTTNPLGDSVFDVKLDVAFTNAGTTKSNPPLPFGVGDFFSVKGGFQNVFISAPVKANHTAIILVGLSPDLPLAHISNKAAGIQTISEVTNVKNIESLDLVDLVTLVSTVSLVDRLGFNGPLDLQSLGANGVGTNAIFNIADATVGSGFVTNVATVPANKKWLLVSVDGVFDRRNASGEFRLNRSGGPRYLYHDGLNYNHDIPMPFNKNFILSKEIHILNAADVFEIYLKLNGGTEVGISGVVHFWEFDA